MSKPLTIEQLKSLKVGDWVWIVDKEIPQYAGYYKIDLFAISHLHLVQGLGKTVIPYSGYGTTWLAYKNKEQAEAKGEIVELPYKVGDKVYLVRGNRVGNMVVSRTKIEMYLYHNRLLVKCSCDSSWHELKNIFTIEEQAAARLKELKGEE